MRLIAIAAVRSARIAGALRGLYRRVSQTTEGIVPVVAGGALIQALVDALVGPAADKAGLVTLA